MMCFAEDIVNFSFFLYLAWFVSESNIYACFMHNEAFFIKKLATVYIFYFQVYISYKVYNAIGMRAMYTLKK